MTIKHQILQPGSSTTPPTTQASAVSTLQGMIGQVAAMSGAGVGTPGVNALGTQINTIAGQITGGGSIAGLGTSLSTAAQGAIAGIVSSLQSALSSLTGALGNITQIIHSHTIDAKLGHILSAFNGKHSTTINQNGITHSSTANVALTAPSIQSNGNHAISDALTVGKTIGAQGAITGSAFGMLSDAKLKTNIRDIEPVLKKLLALQVKTFDVKAFDHETGKVRDIDPAPSVGLIAQELLVLFPTLVRDGKFLSIDVDKLVMVLLAAFIEFAAETKAEMEELREQIAELS